MHSGLQHLLLSQKIAGRFPHADRAAGIGHEIKIVAD
jgi:hypothetical protein